MKGWVKLILVLIEVPVVTVFPTYVQVEFVSRKYKTREFQRIGCMRESADQINVKRFHNRDSTSYIAGYKHAITTCYAHMTPEQREAAGIANSLDVHLKSMNTYELWKENNIEDYA